MASLLKASNEIHDKQLSKRAKGKGKADESAESAAPMKMRKDKVLMLCSRGVTQRHRHLMHDLEVLLPHTKKVHLAHIDHELIADSKLDTKSSLHLINELADLHSCNNALYFETRRHEDLYLWMSRTPNGPSGKFHVQNIHTMDELKMTGNCLRGSRGICVFDGAWEEEEHWKLMKEMFSHVFSVPKSSRRLKPFIDHILLFSILDNKIWFRNFQIIEKDPLAPSGPPVTSLVEIGPRFVLTPIRLFEGSFGGPTLYQNVEYVTPAATRASVKRAMGDKYRSRKGTEVDREERGKKRRVEVGEDELARDKVFA